MCSPGASRRCCAAKRNAIGALHFLCTDIQQPNARLFKAKNDPAIGSTHDRKLHQIARIAFSVRAQIEHHHIGISQGRENAASAGRSIPGIVRSASFAIAISAPVLPALTAADAWPSFTALMARPIELPRDLRMA